MVTDSIKMGNFHFLLNFQFALDFEKIQETKQLSNLLEFERGSNIWGKIP
jgi:hypothetical protein